MRKSILILFMISLASVWAITNNIDPEILQNSDEYIYGRGEANTYDVADQAALKNLSEMMSISISSSFIKQVEEKNIQQGDDSKEKVELKNYASLVVETCSNSFFNETGKTVEKYDVRHNEFIIYRYIRREEKERLFFCRKERAKEYYKQGQKNLKISNLKQTLLDYYSGLLLISSYPTRDTVKVSFNGRKKSLKPLLEQEIRESLLNIKMKPVGEQEQSNFYRISIRAEYDNKPISNLQFSYFDGCDKVTGNILDGSGTIDIDKNYYRGIDNVSLHIYYGRDQNDRNQLIDPELQALASFIHVTEFPDEKLIPKYEHEMQKTDITIEDMKQCTFLNTTDTEEMKSISTIMNRIVESIRNEEYGTIAQSFTEEGYIQYLKLINYGEISIYEDDFTFNYLKLNYQTQVRSLPVVYRLKEDNRQKIYMEKLCFIFENNKVVWVNFALEDHYLDEAIAKEKITGDFQKRILGINFMEYYKTIFSLQEVDLISEVFADSAQIFVGYVKEVKDVPVEMQQELNEKLKNNIEMKKYSKAEYINHLQRDVFPYNDYININFRDAELVRRSIDRPIYAIQLHQEYYSSSYSDEGYLLLFIDFFDENNPQIFFRYWQPEKIGEENLRAIKLGDIRF